MINTVRERVKEALGPIPEQKEKNLERACWAIAQKSLIEQRESFTSPKRRSFSETGIWTRQYVQSLKDAVLTGEPIKEQHELAAYFGKKLGVFQEELEAPLEDIFTNRKKWEEGSQHQFLSFPVVKGLYSNSSKKISLLVGKALVDFDSGIKTVHPMEGQDLVPMHTHEYIVKYGSGKKREASRSSKGVLVRPAESGASRSLVFLSEKNPRVFQLFNRKKKADIKFKGNPLSRITRAVDVESGERFVSFCRKKEEASLRREIDNLRFFQGKKGFVQLEAVVHYASKKEPFEEKTRIFLKEYELGDLSDLCQLGRVGVRDVKYFFCQLVDALVVMHDSGKVHRDIKPSNVLMEYNKDRTKKVAVFTDFECMRDVNTFSHLEGTIKYLSPEIGKDLFKKGLGESIRASFPSDVWALGMLFYNVLSMENLSEFKEVPEKELSQLSESTREFFRSSNEFSFLFNICKGRLPRLPDRDPLSPFRLINDMLDPDPSTRPPAREVQKRMQTLNWEGFFQELKERRS